MKCNDYLILSESLVDRRHLQQPAPSSTTPPPITPPQRGHPQQTQSSTVRTRTRLKPTRRQLPTKRAQLPPTKRAQLPPIKRVQLPPTKQGQSPNRAHCASSVPGSEHIMSSAPGIAASFALLTGCR